jgi:Terminase large subunit, T4likevirus-type, N-terminal
MVCLMHDEIERLRAILDEYEGGLDAIRADARKRKAIWKPFPGPQTEALNNPADIILYGGSAGGGKTDLLLGAALTHQRAIIFRRIFPSLKAIIERARDIYNPLGTARNEDSFNEQLHRWKFGDGRQIVFGSMQHEKDKLDWQGQAYDLHGFDEITEFTESQFRFVTGWNRPLNAAKTGRCRVICTGNPPTTSDGDWVIKFWGPWLDEFHPNPAKPGELRWYTTINGQDKEMPNGDPVLIDGEWITPKSRTFIPAKVQDNPILIKAGYVATLQAFPEPLRSQMLYGDWRAGCQDSEWQVIPTEWVRLAQKRWANTPQPACNCTAIGVDVARGGKDKTVIVRRFRNWFAPVDSFPGQVTPDGDTVAAQVLRVCAPPHQGMPYGPINVDAIGVGAAVVDALRRYPRLMGVRVNPVIGSAGTEHTDESGLMHFCNQRAENWWRMRELLDPKNGHDICLPADAELKADLCAPTWQPTPKGIKIESKEDLIERLGRSPDKGDAAVYAAIQSNAVEVSEDLLAKVRGYQ